MRRFSARRCCIETRQSLFHRQSISGDVCDACLERADVCAAIFCGDAHVRAARLADHPRYDHADDARHAHADGHVPWLHECGRARDLL